MRRTILALALAGLLAACGSEGGRHEEMHALAANVLQAPAAPAQAELPPRDVLDRQSGSYLLAQIEATGGNALMIGLGRNGPVQTWTTGEGTTLSTREGVLVATRGLRGADLMSAGVPSAAALAAGTGGHRRLHVTLDGDDQPIRTQYLCELRNAGAETVILVERRYPVHHIVESCSGAGGGFENHYWIEPAGTLRKSRQWIGPTLGYVELDLLKD